MSVNEDDKEGYIDYKVRVRTSDAGKLQQIIFRFLPSAELIGTGIGLPSKENYLGLPTKPLKALKTRTTAALTKPVKPTKINPSPPIEAESQHFKATRSQQRVLDIVIGGKNTYEDIVQELGFQHTPWAASRILNTLKDAEKLIGNKVEGYFIKEID